MMEKHRFNQSSPSPSQEPTKNAAQEQTQQHGQEHHAITPSRSKYGATFLSVALPISLLAGYWCNRPFSQVLATKTVSIAALSSAQKLNIENAVSRLDTIVLKPGEVFSFNGRIGPRSESRGYLPAPSYVERSSPNTIGGGVCVVSSALYQDALRSGLKIEKRVAHLRTIHTIQAGLDATVWYGGADLQFRNTLTCPIELKGSSNSDQITVEIRGDSALPDWSQAELDCAQHAIPGNRVSVQVTRKQDGRTELVSNDIYEIPTAGERRR